MFWVHACCTLKPLVLLRVLFCELYLLVLAAPGLDRYCTQVSVGKFVCLCLQHLGWQKDREYLRLDGKTVAGKRQALVDSFQDPDSPVQVRGSIAFCLCRKGFE